MKQDVVVKALNEAYSLICSEYESVCDDDLQAEYDRVIHLLEGRTNVSLGRHWFTFFLITLTSTYFISLFSSVRLSAITVCSVLPPEYRSTS